MCGIAGIHSTDTSVHNKISIMIDGIKHRGPDGSNFLTFGQVSLAHTRLAILDLSANASQPMHDSSLGLALTFNGCIYNYQEIKRDLQRLGYTFKSTGDSEVILKAWHKWGEDCLQKLDGMFAFAIYDYTNNSLYLVRDRLGIKPLYYSLTTRGFFFASTLKSILAVYDSNVEVCKEAVFDYLSLHSIVLGNKTIVDNINKLEPGTFLKVSDSSLHIKRYWQLNSNSTCQSSSIDIQKKFERLFKKSIKKRLLGDVDTCVMLSGGLDSSLIVAILNEFIGEDVPTYSIGFESKDGKAGDEFSYSDYVASKFNTDHNKVIVNESDILNNLEPMLLQMSEPMSSHDNIGFYLLSKEISKKYKVALSGQGADEVFGGYPWYKKVQNSNNGVETYIDSFFDRRTSDFKDCIDLRWLADADKPEIAVRKYFLEAAHVDLAQTAMSLDTEKMLPEDPVKRVDNMCMAFGVEARVPFLDSELVEFAFTLQSDSKLSNDGKEHLKNMSRSYFDKKFINRKKGYFPVPQLNFLSGEISNLARESLLSSRFRNLGIFKADYLDYLIDSPDNKISSVGGSQLWQIATLAMWLEAHQIT